MKMTLLNANSIVLTPLGWTILGFFILQLIGLIKWIFTIADRTSTIESNLKNNKEGDRNLKEKVEKAEREIKDKYSLLKSEIRESRNSLFKEQKRIEAKVDNNKDSIVSRHSDMAQGLVGLEREHKALADRVNRMEK